LDFWNCGILFTTWVEKVETHQHAKFRQNLLIGCEGINIFCFFKMAAATILDCRIHEILMADDVWRSRPITVQNFLKMGRSDAEILRFFKFLRWPPPPSWIFENTKFYWLLRWRGSKSISMTNLVKIVQSVAKILTFFNFRRWRPSAILYSFGVYLDHSQWVLVGLYHSAKFGYDRCSSFYNMNISIFDEFGWKMPIHAPKIVFWAIWSPKWGAISTKVKKGTPLRESASFDPLSVKM